MFWHGLSMLTLKDLANELKKVATASEDPIKSFAVVGVKTYKEVHTILNKAINSQYHPY